MKKITLLLLTIILISCKNKSIDGIIIGETLLAHQSLTENRKMENLINEALKKDKIAIIEIKDFPNGGAASTYDLGYVLTQIIYRIGENDFAEILIEIPETERIGFDGLIDVGLEYGDNDYDGKMDNKRMASEFPKLSKILNKQKTEEVLYKNSYWKKLKCGLYKNKSGEIGFQTEEVFENGTFKNNFLTSIYFDSDSLVIIKDLSNVVDTITFRNIGGNYHKDKNYIYEHSERSDGGYIKILDVDFETFETIGDCYAKDKNNIYLIRYGKIENVDYKTFKTVEGIGCFAKDKNGYYFWDEKIKEEHYSDINEIIIELNKKASK
ncbi:DKNYY domain-containing protein [Aureivirga sp. CE67]|uniref:DKNYY domain-containing protein n=1 Tax=Aureivirga sp. CE67 TaxID=1788983 RepID=UPI0018CADD50|nr:DKNYY domain-containing protein [Aureivirga sp. CE67]